MKKEKSGQEPAFPFRDDYKSSDHVFDGMSKRFYAACAAMQGVLAGGGYYIGKDDAETLVKRAYEFADELLKQENYE